MLAHGATNYLSGKLGTRVHVDRVYIRFFKSVVLDGLYVEDQHHDTLLYAKELNADITHFNLEKHIIEIKSVQLNDADVNLIRYKGEKHDNIKFITDFFATPGSKDTTSKKLNLSIKNVHLNEVHFIKRNENKQYDTLGVDFNNLDVAHINGELNDITFVKDSMFFNIKGLTFKERSGFAVNEISAKAKFGTGEWHFQQLAVITPLTQIHTDLTFHLDSIDDFDDFDTKVDWISNFKNSTISLADIAYFAHDLWGRTNQLKLSGDFKGKWSKFRAKNVFIGIGEHTWFKGDLAMTGLSDIDETFMEIQAEDVQGTKAELETIPVPPFNSSNHIHLPPNIATLGKMNFKGRFTGFINDFVAYGNVSTAIGYLSSDINLKFDDKKNMMAYSGHLAANNFHAGKFLSIDDLGPVSFSMDIKGNGVSKEKADANLAGIISSIEFKKYAYKNVKLNSEISKKLFNGSLSVHDDNVDFDFNGNIDFRNELPEFNFTAKVGKAHLDTLNLFKLQGEAELQTTLNIKIKGNKIDNLEGSVEAVNTNYHADNIEYHVNSVLLESRVNNNSRSINLNSDFLDATVNGKFEFATLVDGFRKVLPRYLPSVILPLKNNIVSKQDFTFDLHFKNTDLITENFLPQWYIEPNTTLKGNYNSIQNNIEFHIQSPLIRYTTFNFYDANLQVNADSTTARLNFKAGYLITGGHNRIELPSLNAEAENNKINFRLKVADSAVYASHADISGGVAFESNKKFSVHIAESSVYIENNHWKLDSLNVINFNSSAINVSHLGFANGIQELQLTGVVAKNDSDVLQMTFKNFHLENINPFISGIKIGGSANGNASVTDVYRKIKVASDLAVDQLQINNDMLGNAKLLSKFDNDNKILSVNASIINGAKTIFTVNGQYFTAKKDDNLDFRIHLEDLYLDPLKEYTKDVMNLITARLSGELQLRGTPAHPLFTGLLSLQRARIVVNYLNTLYTFTNNIIVNEDNFELKDFVINDENNKSAVANGKIYHDNFKNFRFDIKLAADHFQVLNTTANQNPLYYGTAIGTGKAIFYGPPDNMQMRIAMTSEKGTQIYLPLSGTTEISQSDFITFVSKIPDSTQKILKPEMTGVDLNLDLEVTTDAVVQIIFDEKIGDKITGRGSGNINLALSPAGDFAIKGQFLIDRGDYLFTLQNVINRRFTLDKGGTISWNGDPYDADVDLSATYKTRASLYDLDPLDSSLKGSVTIECKLILKNKLMNPTVSFEITAPGADPNAQTALQSSLNNEFEKSKQAASLLFQNKFMLASIYNSGSATGPQVDANASLAAGYSQLLSNQLSNVLAQANLLPVTLGFNYQTRDVYTKQELEVMFSKTVLNDRISIDGNVGVATGAGITSASNASSLIGDFSFDYRASENVRLRVFNKTNTNTIIFNNSPYTQGVGIFFRKEFDTLRSFKKRVAKQQQPVTGGK